MNRYFLDKLRNNIFRYRYSFARRLDVQEINKLHFFVIRGFPKSGTNWLGNLMNLHPQVYACGEFGFSRFAEAREHAKQVSTWTVLHQPDMEKRLDFYFEQMLKSLIVDAARLRQPINGKTWLGDKTPGKAYPPTIDDAKCFYIIRDIRDVTVSRAYHLMRVNGSWGLKSFPKMIQKMERYGGNLKHFQENPTELLDDLDWVRDNAKAWVASVGQLFGSNFCQLRELYPDYQIQVVRYEDLHTDVEAARMKCYEFLNLDPAEAAPLDSGEIKTSAGFTTEQPQQFYRKGAVGDWRNYFNQLTQDVVLEEAGELLQKAGYIL